MFQRHRETIEAMLSGSRFGGSILCKKNTNVANDQHQKLERITHHSDRKLLRRKKWLLLRGSSVTRTDAIVAGCGDYPRDSNQPWDISLARDRGGRRTAELRQLRWTELMHSVGRLKRWPPPLNDLQLQHGRLCVIYGILSTMDQP